MAPGYLPMHNRSDDIIETVADILHRFFVQIIRFQVPVDTVDILRVVDGAKESQSLVQVSVTHENVGDGIVLLLLTHRKRRISPKILELVATDWEKMRFVERWWFLPSFRLFGLVYFAIRCRGVVSEPPMAFFGKNNKLFNRYWNLSSYHHRSMSGVSFSKYFESW